MAVNESAMGGGGETALSGEYLQQLRARCAGGDLLALSENVRNLFREVLVRLVASARRHDKKTKKEHDQKKRCEFFHNVSRCLTPELRHAGPTGVNREAEPRAPSRVACSVLV